MTTGKPICKVLVLDEQPEEAEKVKQFCKKHNLVPTKAHSQHVVDVLSSKIFLGAIFLSEEFDRAGSETVSLGEVIHALRPELPIFLRSSHVSSIEESGDDMQHFYAAKYHADSIDLLNPLIDRYIFSMNYPDPLVTSPLLQI